MYYAVKKGRKVGIYNDWESCSKQVTGYSGAMFKKFSRLEDAQAFLKSGNQSKPVTKENITQNQTKDLKWNNENANLRGLVAYIDGSFRVEDKSYSYGIVYLQNGNIIGKDSQRYHGGSEITLRNVAGELASCIVATKKAISMGFDTIHIFYDYFGIEKWATGEWETNNDTTKRYKYIMDMLRPKIEIKFHKVRAHSGNKYNGMADKLAKNAE